MEHLQTGRVSLAIMWGSSGGSSTSWPAKVLQLGFSMTKALAPSTSNTAANSPTTLPVGPSAAKNDDLDCKSTSTLAQSVIWMRLKCGVRIFCHSIVVLMILDLPLIVFVVFRKIVKEDFFEV